VQFKHKQLKNGLTVIAEISTHAKSTAIGFFVRTGGRDESAEVSGVSHFLEHMMFKGTDKRSALDVNLEFDQMGAKYNAFTSEENTVYYAAVLPEYQQRVLALWADLLRPALRDDDFNVEKGVILEEIAMYKDMPSFDVLDRCRKLHFGDHSCGNSVLGSIESIKALSSRQMRDYFNKRYGPENMVLACAGKVDWQKIIEQAEQLCGNWQPGAAARQLSDYRGTGQTEATARENVVREHICLMSAAPSGQDRQRYAAGVLANIVGDATSSRLYWDLVDTALADSADMEYEPMDGTGAFYTYISCGPEDIKKVVSLTRKCLKKVQNEGVTEKELQASQNKIASIVTLNGELPMGRLVPLGSNWVYLKEYHSLAEELRQLQAVTLDDIKNVLHEYPLDKITIQGLGPLSSID